MAEFEPRPSAWGGLTAHLGTPAQRGIATCPIPPRLPSAPVLLGPVGVLSIVHADAERAVARAAAAVGLTMVLSTAASTAMETVAGDLGDNPGWYQLSWPNNEAVAASLVSRAE